MTDEALGARLAVEHLVELGHERIVHIDGGSGAGAAPRRAGYSQGHAPRSASDARATVLAGDFTEHGRRAGRRAPAARAQAADRRLRANDLAAAGVIDRLEDDGVRIPEDVSIVGYDNTFLAALHHMSLTTSTSRARRWAGSRSSCCSSAPTAARAPVVRHTEPTLVVRKTTGPAR